MGTTVVLLSGGLDSAVCLLGAARSGHAAGCVFVDWGQPSRVEEAAAAARIASRACVELVTVRAGFPVGPMHVQPGASGARVVIGRNLTFLALASSWCGYFGASDVTIGCSGADSAAYPDCRLPWIRRASDLSRVVYGITYTAPLATLDRAGVRAIGASLGIGPSDVWSCYAPRDGAPCGSCNSCRQDK